MSRINGDRKELNKNPQGKEHHKKMYTVQNRKYSRNKDPTANADVQFKKMVRKIVRKFGN